MAQDAPAPAARTLDPADPAATLDFDLFCQRCAYNLRTLPRNSRCPECGTPISLSIQAHLLEFTDPHWIGRLALGGRIVIAALLAFVAAVVPATMAATSSVAHIDWVLWVDGAFLVALLVGAWVLASPNPALARVEGRWAARRVLRVAIAASALGVVATIVTQQSTYAYAVRLLILEQTILGPAGLSGLVALLALAVYARSLAHRLGDDGLATYSLIVALAYGALWLLFAVSLLLAVYPNSEMATLLALVSGLLGLPCGILILCLPAQLVKRLRLCRKTAEANFAAAIAASAARAGSAALP